MAISQRDWQQIQKYVEKRMAEAGEYFTQGIVIKNDQQNNLVWLKEFGDLAIPVFAFDYQVKYYYEDTSGNMQPRLTKPYDREVSVLVPQVGETVLIARQLGSRNLPKCLGVIRSAEILGGD